MRDGAAPGDGGVILADIGGTHARTWRDLFELTFGAWRNNSRNRCWKS